MALSLSAEQKNINHIFNSSDIYIVPSYQRPYSWEYEQCYQLYIDITEAYNSSTEYFIGNIIIAKGKDASGKLYTVDGQQRLITVWLMMRVLYLMCPTSRVLRQKTEIESREEGQDNLPSIKSEVFEKADEEALKRIYLIKDEETLAMLYKRKKNNKGRVVESRCSDRLEANTLWFYYWLSGFKEKDEEKCKRFIDFLLDHIYMLPIELSESTISAANDKALKIFETINNRGMNLEDADIFKARLYDKANALHEGDLFVDDWSSFRVETENMGLNVDDVFRYYSHIIRGKQGITTSLINLREFFTESSFSPLQTLPYNKVMQDLWQVIDSLAQLKNWREAKCDGMMEREVAKWIQALDCYTNQYPSFAVVTYLFYRGYSHDTHDEFVRFLKRLVRYVYLMGTTTTIKFEVFNIIKRIAAQDKDLIPDEIFKPLSTLTYHTRLRKGFALLDYYIGGGDLLQDYSVDKILTAANTKGLPYSHEKIEEVLQSIGNDILLHQRKKYLTLNDKIGLFKIDKKYDVYRQVYDSKDVIVAIEERTSEIKLRLENFFLNNAENKDREF